MRAVTRKESTRRFLREAAGWWDMTCSPIMLPWPARIGDLGKRVKKVPHREVGISMVVSSSWDPEPLACTGSVHAVCVGRIACLRCAWAG